MNQQTIKLPIKVKRVVRELANARCNMPVQVVAGDKQPTLAGEGYHWETNGGTRISHPSAYAKRGWSNMKYVASTLCVEVGEQWLLNEPQVANAYILHKFESNLPCEYR